MTDECERAEFDEAACRATCDICIGEAGEPWPCARQRALQARAALAATPTPARICLLCGAEKPCMTETDLKPGDPGVPCTFDPTPQELYAENIRLRKLLESTPAQAPAQPVAWGQLGTLNGATYLRMNYDRTPYPPPADVVRNLNLVPLYAVAPPQAVAQPVDEADLKSIERGLQYIQKLQRAAAAPPQAVAQPVAQVNQCDGCRRGLPLRNGIHYGKDSHDLIACTAARYRESALTAPLSSQGLTHAEAAAAMSEGWTKIGNECVSFDPILAAAAVERAVLKKLRQT